MGKSTVKTLEIAGLVIFAIGAVVWYATPGDVIVGPVIIMMIGAIVAGIAWLSGRARTSQSTSELVDRVRGEREQTQHHDD